MSMKDKTLCLYWPPYDKVLNIRRIADGVEFEIKTWRNKQRIKISFAQMRNLVAWLEENNI